jgi:hypothetical protein
VNHLFNYLVVRVLIAIGGSALAVFFMAGMAYWPSDDGSTNWIRTIAIVALIIAFVAGFLLTLCWAVIREDK